jgi:hypothetical protein
MDFPHWGDVPEWLAAGSLLLAFQIFRRDRAKSDRAQVDSVGVWPEVRGSASLPGGPRHDEVGIRWCIRNASDRPVEVDQVAWSFETQWGVPAPTQPVPPDHPDFPALEVRKYVPGKPDVLRLLGMMAVPPQKTQRSLWFPIVLTGLAPDADALLSFMSGGIRPIVKYILVTDNSGRRWETRLKRGKRARRIHWYSRRGPHYPSEWQSPVGRRFRALKAKAREWARKLRRRPPASSVLGPGGEPAPINQQY